MVRSVVWVVLGIVVWMHVATRPVVLTPAARKTVAAFTLPV